MAQLAVSLGDAGGVVLPAAILESLGLQVGDTVLVTVTDRQLICPSREADRRQRVEAITQEVFERRRDAYQRLA